MICWRGRGAHHCVEENVTAINAAGHAVPTYPINVSLTCRVFGPSTDPRVKIGQARQKFESRQNGLLRTEIHAQEVDGPG
jgi:hypothetical protein